MASGVTISLLAYFSYLRPVAKYYGIGASVASLVTLVVFRAFSSSELSRNVKNANSFSELQKVLEGAKVDVSWLGSRNVSVPNIKGTVTVNSVASKVERMVGERNFSYSEEERSTGEALVNNITPLFNESNTLLQNNNFITKSFHFLSIIPTYVSSTANIHGRWFYGNGEGSDSWFSQNLQYRSKRLLGRFFW